MASRATSSAYSMAAPPPSTSTTTTTTTPSKLNPSKTSPTTTTTTTTTTTASRALRRPTPRRPSGIGKIITAAVSTPNLRGAYSTTAAAADSSPSSKFAPPIPLLLLQRKASHAALALTSSSLAALPDASGSYALANLNTSPSRSTTKNMAHSPLTPRATASFGAELSVGDTVEVPGNMLGMVRFVGGVQGKKGVFTGVELLPDFAARGKNNGDVDGVSYFTTSIPGAGIFLPLNKAIKRDSPANSAATSFNMSPAAAANGSRTGTQNSTNHSPNAPSTAQFNRSVDPGRAASPNTKRSRPSLARPESPVRKLSITPGSRPSLGAPPARNAPRFTSPTQTKFSQSARGPGTPNDPSKGRSLQPGRNYSMGPRSISAMSGRSQGFPTDDEVTPVANGVVRPRENGRLSALRGPSRQGSLHDDELERLRAEVADRDRQLREQQATLTEMETSLTEVQNLMQQADLPSTEPMRRGSLADKDTTQLRAIIKDKNEMIARLTAEFDANRADFRSTIDTLELASTETERVYEKKIEELMKDIYAIQERNSDVDAVATQLKQLEELVQELEEGLEDARRGEAEARGEVEFLRGEVERTRAELRREREKANSGTNGTNGASNGDQSALFKEIDQKEDEIRGLKAIIHSLSRDNVPGAGEGDRPPASAEDTAAREKLEREVAELRALLDTKNTHEEALEQELEALRRGSASTLRSGDGGRSSESRDTMVKVNMVTQTNKPQPTHPHKAHTRLRTMESRPESDDMSSVTENSTLWCELCETSGHDILTCTNMFGGSQKGGDGGSLAPISEVEQYKIAPLSPRIPPPPESQPSYKAPPPSMLDPGPVAGKESGIIDHDAWCALCEKDGHTSVDCPFEDAF